MKSEREPGGFTGREVVVRLHPERRRSLPGLVVAMELGGGDPVATVDFPRPACPLLRVGERVAMRIEHRSLDGGILTAGRVLFRSEDPVRHRYEFQLGSKERSILSPLVNRRGEARICPDDRLRAEVSTEGGEEYGEVPIRDISASGLAFLVTPNLEQALFTEGVLSIRLAFEQDDQCEALLFTGIIKNRRLSGSAITYGVEFEEESTVVFERKKDRIRSYVRERQVLVARTSREKRADLN